MDQLGVLRRIRSSPISASATGTAQPEPLSSHHTPGRCAGSRFPGQRGFLAGERRGTGATVARKRAPLPVVVAIVTPASAAWR